MSRYIDADLIQYEPMLRPQGNGNYEDCEIAYKDVIDVIPTADVVEVVQRNEEFDRVIEELLEIEAKNDIGYFTSSERSQFNAYVEDLLSMTIERAEA